METKPYSLQAPEQIAKEYGGNKQKIAEAMQMGVLDPTAGTLAGMFIDRMRAAAQQEQAPTQTVAEQIFAPPAPMGMPPQGGLPVAPPPPMGMPPMGPPAGLGTTPEAAQMPQMGMPPQGMPPMDMPPPEQPPMGMAEGGLATLPLPNAMFNEPNNGSYAGGGIVSFAMGEEVEDEDEEIIRSKGTTTDIVDESAVEATGGIGVSKRKAAPPVVTTLPGTDYAVPSEMYGRSADPFANFDKFDEMAPRKTTRAEQLQAYLDAALDPATKKAKAKDDFMTAIGMMGAKMASTPGSLFQSFNAGAAEAIPQLSSTAAARNAAEREAINTLVAEERTGNTELQERANAAYEKSKDFGTFAEAMKDREFRTILEREGFNVRILEARLNAGASIKNALTAAGASMYSSDRQIESDRFRFNTEVARNVGELTSKGGANYLPYRNAVNAGKGNQYLKDLTEALGGGNDPFGFRR